MVCGSEMPDRARYDAVSFGEGAAALAVSEHGLLDVIFSAGADSA
jgi:hypothetical protein